MNTPFNSFLILALVSLTSSLVRGLPTNTTREAGQLQKATGLDLGSKGDNATHSGDKFNEFMDFLSDEKDKDVKKRPAQGDDSSTRKSDGFSSKDVPKDLGKDTKQQKDLTATHKRCSTRRPEHDNRASADVGKSSRPSNSNKDSLTATGSNPQRSASKDHVSESLDKGSSAKPDSQISTGKSQDKDSAQSSKDSTNDKDNINKKKAY
jgi:hypothetical protein